MSVKHTSGFEYNYEKILTKRLSLLPQFYKGIYVAETKD